MSKLKTNKSALKRFKITPKKLLHRPRHQNHFNAKDSGKETRNKRGYKSVPAMAEKNMRRLMPYDY